MKSQEPTEAVIWSIWQATAGTQQVRQHLQSGGGGDGRRIK